MVRVVCISDTHTYHESVDLPHGDILVHAGDFTFKGREHEVRAFGKWFNAQPHKHKIVIAGNHDLSFQDRSTDAINWLYNDCHDASFHYLQDTSIVVNVDGRDIKIYGSPWQPEFHDWAFNVPRNTDMLKAIWKNIPADTDILITHGPPYGIGDLCDHGERVGCHDLLARVKELNLKLHVFGHIHENYGSEEIAGTTFVNAASCNLRHQPVQKAIVVDL